MKPPSREIQLQRDYYNSTAEHYDVHLEKDWEHTLALHLLGSYIEFHNICSVLDVGAGTGRAMLWLKSRYPHLIVKGVEPVEALRERAVLKGVAKEDLCTGDGYDLAFSDNEFDLVCQFAMLHHVREPARVIREMSRVASRMVSLSDANFMGQGPLALRCLKTLLYVSRLWPFANWLKTGGKGYTESKDDGLAYSYSVFQNMSLLKGMWNTVRVTSLSGSADTMLGSLFTAKQVFLVATNKIVRTEIN